MDATTAREHSLQDVRFEMRLTPEETRQITLLSQQEGKPMEKVIVMLARQALRQISPNPLSAREIMRLPQKEREAMVSRQFQDAEKLYQDNPDLIVPDVDPPLTY